METGDANDFMFYPVAPTTDGDDKMILSQARQFLYFNYAGTAPGTPLRGRLSSSLDVAIVSGALALAAAGATLTALTAF